jgi:hypothetical protein
VVSFAKRSCFTEFAQHCASQHVCCLNHLFPDRSGQARKGAAGPGKELLQRHGVVRTSQLVVPTGQVDGMPQHLAEKTTATRERSKHTLRRGRRYGQCAEACF